MTFTPSTVGRGPFYPVITWNNKKYVCEKPFIFEDEALAHATNILGVIAIYARDVLARSKFIVNTD